MIIREIVFSYCDSLYLECPPFFKIYKCPDNFPQPPFEMAHHPYFIEYEVDKTPVQKALKGSREIKRENKFCDNDAEVLSESFSQQSLNSKVKNKYLCLINALTNHFVFTYGSRVKQGWCIGLETGKGELIYAQEGYRTPDYETQVSKIEFHGTHRVLDALLRIVDEEGEDYRTIGLTDLVSIYTSIKDEEFKSWFLNACAVFNKAQHLSSIEISASYIFMISAIEALISVEYKGVKVESCKSCGQPKYKVNKKFKEFVDKYGYGIDNKTKNLLYNLRSKIAHEGQLLASSYDYNFFITSQEDLDEEYLALKHNSTHKLLSNLTQVCFSKFLFSRESL